MTRKPNEYRTPEILEIGSAQDIILGEKVLYFLNTIVELPYFRRPDTFALYDDYESPD